MTARAFYRASIWLPVVVPVFIAVFVHGAGLRVESPPARKLVQLLLMSLVYGGVPCAVLAVWATWRVGRLSEPEIRRLMLRAPFLMSVIYLPVIVVVGLAAGAPLGPLVAVGVLGAFVSIPLGFIYVGMVSLLRAACGTRLV